MLYVLRNSDPAQPGPSWPTSLHWSRQPGRRSPGGNQGSSAPQPYQAAHSLSLSRTRGHSLSPGTPPHCPALLALRNPGPALSGPTRSPGPGHPDSSLQFFHSAWWSRRPARLCTRLYPRLREDAEFYWIPPASLRRSRQPGRRSPRSSQGSPASHTQQAARSLSLTRGRPPGSGSPRLCPTLLTLRNPGPAQLGVTFALGPGCLGSSCGSSSRPGGPNCQPGSAASGSHSWHPGGC
ncbi:hypothetical protein NDU88_006261 [Pleurodeles waltl]|uniref:Uncharacterized protein n=1 Tax=Pleurodeles waltl TaxID=8319 RepID=A0AAV7ULL6_PLEWA|nr:hypothetical protein NDU88_006261 [Pleurodeles waltl]